MKNEKAKSENLKFESTLEFARQLDEKDPLRSFREKFIIPTHNGREQIYFLGNSLGLQPKSARGAINEILDQWSQLGVEGFFLGEKPWYHYHDLISKPLANIVGAKPSEVVAMNQLTVNLHLMMASFYRPSGKRKKILCEVKAFPSDQYMLESFCKFIGKDPDEIIIEISPRKNEQLTRREDILKKIEQHKDELALVFWSGVNYYTGQVFDVESITKAAHEIGATAGFDLAHAAGNIPLQLHAWNVDFACWCSYKYLNSGPGGIGNAFIHERFHTDTSLNRLAGWWGFDKDTRFRMEKGFKPIQSAEGWQLSTPSIMLYAAHKSALEIFEEAGMERLRTKSKLLSGYLFFLLQGLDIEILTPTVEDERGCQLSMLMKKNGKLIFKKLSEAGIFADWREPDVIRIAPVPLYNTFEEVFTFASLVRSFLIFS